MGGRREYTQAREAGARGVLKAAEREGPLSQNTGVSDMALQEPVVEGATGRGGTWSEHGTHIFWSIFEARPDADRSRLKVWTKNFLSTPVHQLARGATRPSSTSPQRILTVRWHVPRCQDL